MDTSFTVRLWRPRTIETKRGTTYQQRWRVGERKQPFSRTFEEEALLEGFRDDMKAAMRRGEAFDLESGLPASIQRTEVTAKQLDPACAGPSWFEHAVEYAAYKWPRVSGKQRASVAEVLTSITSALLPPGPARPEERELRRALKDWAFTPGRPEANHPVPDTAARVLAWVAEHAPTLAVLDDLECVRGLLDRLSRRDDGQLAAMNYFTRRRTVLYNVCKFAVTKQRLAQHPLERADLNWERPDEFQKDETVDPRSVGNTAQVEAMLTALSYVGNYRGPHLIAFFASMYYAMLRPSEATNLKERQLVLPEAGWGSITLEGAAPVVGRRYTDTGLAHDVRGLKRRRRGATRTVPIPPRLVALLRAHLERFGTCSDGRLFRTRTGQRIDASTYRLVWRLARNYGIAMAERDTPRLKRPYDLRHSGVSLRCTAGVPVRQVAEWAGHSVEVLLRIYSKVLEGYDDRWEQQMDEFLDA